jgi:hypothetical protein
MPSPAYKQSEEEVEFTLLTMRDRKKISESIFPLDGNLVSPCE